MAVSGWSRGEGLYQPEDKVAAIPVPTMYVSSNYFSTIGVTLPRGPGFTQVDDASRAEPEAVIGHRVWQVRFNSDPNIIGRRVKINQTDYVVVGVTPEEFRGHTSGLNDGYYQLWLPLSRHPRLVAAAACAWRGMRRGSASSRGCPAARPWRRRMRSCSPRWRRSRRVIPRPRRTRPAASSRTFPPGARMRAQISAARLMMFGLSGIVLLVVGLNISGMMLVRSAMRQRELAVRLAMGASRWRLVRYHLSEALVMAILGGSLASAHALRRPDRRSPGRSTSWGPALESVRARPVAGAAVHRVVLRHQRRARRCCPRCASAARRSSRRSRMTPPAAASASAASSASPRPHRPDLRCRSSSSAASISIRRARPTFADVGFTPQGLYAARLDLAARSRRPTTNSGCSSGRYWTTWRRPRASRR